MVIVDVDIPAGPTIEEAIRECLDFSERCGCMVRVKLNDVPMLIADSPVFGKNKQERVKLFANEFHYKLEQHQEGSARG